MKWILILLIWGPAVLLAVIIGRGMEIGFWWAFAMVAAGMLINGAIASWEGDDDTGPRINPARPRYYIPYLIAAILFVLLSPVAFLASEHWAWSAPAGLLLWLIICLGLAGIMHLARVRLMRNASPNPAVERDAT